MLWISLAQQATQPAEADVSNMFWPVLMVALLATLICVWLHYEALRFLMYVVSQWLHSARRSILATVIFLVLLHLVEIMIFAGGYVVLYFGFGSDIGQLQGNFDDSIGDLIYFSFVVYTTVGFGDIVPVGPIRIYTGVEALVGLMLITWSASFTFLIMQEHWRHPVDGVGS